METHKAPSSADEFELAHHALVHVPVSGVSGKGPGHHKPEKVMKEMHVHEVRGGGYTVHLGSETGPPHHVAHDLDTVHDHMEEHMGTPNDGEAEADSGTGEHAGGSGAERQSMPGGGQGEGGVPPHMEA
jgi:hypothetical protein